ATGLTAGTVAYMSPEQLSANPMSTASDIYSLGVIAFELITGRRPFNPDSMFQLLEMQRSGIRVKPADLRPSLSERAQTVILRALAFDPKDRFQRARDFGDQLERALMAEAGLGEAETKDLQTTEIATPQVPVNHSEREPKPTSLRHSALSITLAVVVAA